MDGWMDALVNASINTSYTYKLGMRLWKHSFRIGHDSDPTAEPVRELFEDTCRFAFAQTHTCDDDGLQGDLEVAKYVGYGRIQRSRVAGLAVT
jgi:hypothetical protein